MRILVPLSLLVLLAPAASGHDTVGGTQGHLSVGFGPLNPGQSLTYHLQPDPQENITRFEAGWLFMVYGGVPTGEPPIAVNLSLAGVDVAKWNWRGDNQSSTYDVPEFGTTISFSFNTTLLPWAGEYDITFTNPGNATTHFVFYYDQSCNCKGKVVPLPGGRTLLNYDLPAGRDVLLSFWVRAGLTASATLATLPGNQGVWPGDFVRLASVSKTGPATLELRFKTATDERHYIIVQGTQGVGRGKEIPTSRSGPETLPRSASSRC